MLSKDVRKIMEDYKEYLEIFEIYDRTGKFPLDRVRVDLTLKRRNLDKLREASGKRKAPMSRIVDELIEKGL